MKLIFIILSCFLFNNSFAQLSNAQIMKIKDDADDGKGLWLKLFEDGYTKNDMSGLPALRKTDEAFLNQNISQLSRMYAEGDGRELVLAVKNYLIIEKQFVKDIMIPAESLKPGDNESYNDINKKISDFGMKERSFDIDISNAYRNSPEPLVIQQEADNNEQQDTDEEEMKQQEEARPHRKGKLPHETYGKKSRKKKKNTEEEDEE